MAYRIKALDFHHGLLVHLAISSEPGSARQLSSLARRRERVISCDMASECNNASGEEGRLNLAQNLWRAALVFLLLAISVLPTQALSFQQEDVEIKTIQVAKGVYMLQGQGGNIGVSVGEDSTFIIDDQFAPLTAKITKAIEKIAKHPVEFVLNTHWHFDHTGGNENFGNAGALIVAHENVRRRMGVEQFMEAFDRRVPASPKEALPVVTFSESVTFHLNEDHIHAYHVEPAHTDGDSVIHFDRANVFHMGDLFFNGSYPFIDLSSGGSFTGMLAAAETVLEQADENSKIIPGHGALATRQDLVAYRDVLKTVHQRVSQLIAQGKSLEEVLATRPTAEFDESWGAGFMNAQTFLTIVYNSLTQKN